MKLSLYFVILSWSIAGQSTPKPLPHIRPRASSLARIDPEPGAQGHGPETHPRIRPSGGADRLSISRVSGEEDLEAPGNHGSFHERMGAHSQEGHPEITEQADPKPKKGKRSADSPLDGILGTATTTVGSLPVVGVPLAGLLSSLPLSSVASPGAVSGLVSTVTTAAQNAPVLGGLLRILPLNSLLSGNPVDNVKNTVSGLLVSLPVVGGPLAGLASTASGVASSLPISLVTSRAVSAPASTSMPTEQPLVSNDQNIERAVNDPSATAF